MNRIICGDALDALQSMDAGSVDCVITSPPYWRMRDYAGGGMGNETDVGSYVASLQRVFVEIRRVLKRTGSAWLNLGDKYENGSLIGVPWRVALALADDKWCVRQEAIWHKRAGTVSAHTNNRLRPAHEHMFHLTLMPYGYYWDGEAIAQRSRSRIERGNASTYLKRINMSERLSVEEKRDAACAVNEVAAEVKRGKINGFRFFDARPWQATHAERDQAENRQTRVLHHADVRACQSHDCD